MKKLLISTFCVIAMITLLVVSCKTKNNNNLTPTYKNQSTGTGANPNINVVTVTGQQTPGNPATENTSFAINSSMPGWNFESYANHPTYFKATNGNSIIEIHFSGPINAGTYSLTSGLPAAGQARIIVYGAPGQPSEVVWYSKSGTVTVSGTTPNFTATFSNIPCFQLNYLFPTVIVSGNVIC